MNGLSIDFQTIFLLMHWPILYLCNRKLKKMKARLFVVVLIMLTAAGTTCAQNGDLFYQLNDDQPGYGKISLVQDDKLYKLIEAYADANKRDGIKGYRIQIYSGSGQNARATMQTISQQFLKNFPDFDPAQVYPEYKTPYFKLCVGDFRSRGEANAFYHVIRALYPDSYIVNSKIKFPKLTPDDVME